MKRLLALFILISTPALASVTAENTTPGFLSTSGGKTSFIPYSSSNPMPVSLSAANIIGTLPVANGGTGATAFGSPNVQTGTTYTVQSTDNATYLIFSSSTAVAVTLPQATTSGFTSGFGFCATNINSGLVTITPTTSTINSATTLVLYQGKSACVVSDGNNYQVAVANALPAPIYSVGGTALSLGISVPGIYLGATNTLYFAGGSGIFSGLIDTTGHWRFGGVAGSPSVASNACGSTTQGTVQSGNDNAFVFTAGTSSVTSCAITFHVAYGGAPHNCLLTPMNATAAAWGTTGAYISSISASTLTIAGLALDGAKYGVFCD